VDDGIERVRSIRTELGKLYLNVTRVLEDLGRGGTRYQRGASYTCRLKHTLNLKKYIALYSFISSIRYKEARY